MTKWDINIIMLMIFIPSLTFLFLTTPGTGFGQQSAVPVMKSSAIMNVSKQDSVESSRGSLPPLRLTPTYENSQSGREIPLLLPQTGSGLAEAPAGHPPSLVFFFESLPGTAQDVSGKGRWLLDKSGNLLIPPELDLQSGRSARLLQSIFGAAEVGGVAYLLYLHVKRYGVK